MRTKPLSIVFVLMLLMSMAVVVHSDPWDNVTTNPTDAQAIWVDPKNTTGLNIGTDFIVDVLVNVTDPDGAGPATGMYGFQYKLYWNASILNLILNQSHEWVPGWTGIYVASNKLENWTGGLVRHNFAVSATSGVAFTGVVSLATYKFEPKWQPEEPAPNYIGLLDIQDDILVDDTATPFAHTTTDGVYQILSIIYPAPKLEVYPDHVVGVYAQNFTINIIIPPAHPLSASKDMMGWEAKLSYNTTMLDALTWVEGPFMPGFAGPNGTYPICNINDTAGIIHMGDLFLGNHTVPTGSGTLMSITFNASWQYKVPPDIPPKTCALDLYDDLMVNTASEPIDHLTNDGSYEAPYKMLLWALDCWTDPYRKLNEGNSYLTPNMGKGINMTADAYEPQEFVKLYALLTYNEYPEQNKIVMFEIHGPTNEFDNITIYLTAITNATGVATVNFTIPHPCTNLEETIFGKWVCYQAAQVKNPWKPELYEKVSDWLWWDVGWKVELLNVTAQEPTWPCGTLNITIWYKNIAQVPMHVIFAFTIFDCLLDPVAETLVHVDVLAGVYCNPTVGTRTVSVHLPKWSHVGPNARVSANAFTDLPMQCGLPYCPEVVDYFTISLPP